MLRLLARTIAHLWEEKPGDATAIHLHHIDPGYEPIRQEIVTRLGQSAYVPAITNDVAAGSVGKKALAEEIDASHHGGLPPYAVYVARTIFIHTLAFNDPLKGISPEQLRYSVLSPATDISFIEEARKKFIAESAYLDDRPGSPMRFLAEANLRQIIRREERHVDAGEARAQLNDRIREIFGGKTFETVPFPGGPFDVPDEVSDGRPKLAVLAYDGVTIGGSVENVPELIERIYTRKGSEGSALRALRNNLVFVVADDARKEEMHRKAYHRLALQELKKPERLADLAEHQQDQVREMEARSEHELAIAIQQCYRHVFYPSRNRVGASEVDLAHSAIDIQSTSDQPGAGQHQIVRALRDLNKLRLVRGRAGLACLCTRPHTAQEGSNRHVGAARRVPPRSGVTYPDRRRSIHPRPAEGYRAGRVCLSARRFIVRTRRSVSQHHDRRAIRGIHHDLRQECGYLAPEKAGGTRGGGSGRERDRPTWRHAGRRIRGGFRCGSASRPAYREAPRIGDR